MLLLLIGIDLLLLKLLLTCAELRWRRDDSLSLHHDSGSRWINIAILLAPKAFHNLPVDVRVVCALDRTRCRLFRHELDEGIAFVLKHSNVVYAAKLTEMLQDQIVAEDVRLKATTVDSRVGRTRLVVDLLVVGRLALAGGDGRLSRRPVGTNHS